MAPEFVPQRFAEKVHELCEVARDEGMGKFCLTWFAEGYLKSTVFNGEPLLSDACDMDGNRLRGTL